MTGRSLSNSIMRNMTSIKSKTIAIATIKLIKSMSKLYKCAKNCGSIEEMQDDKIPACCGCKMMEIKDEELFGCPGCAGCDLGCGKASGDNSPSRR